MNSNVLQLDQFVRSVGISQNEIFAFFLGAGASITSGIPSASDCIWSWKQSIFIGKSGHSLNGLDYKTDSVKGLIQKWLNQDGSYPPEGVDGEYSYYAEQCYPIEEDRSKFFRAICEGREPSIGYKLLVLLHQIGIVQSVWTTNFDELAHKAAMTLGCSPIDITLDSVSRIIRPQNSTELPIVKLHGDYRFGPLKNTETELRQTDETFRSSLVNYLADKHLVVVGYSGRDASVMKALMDAYSRPGAGRLYWCGYGHDIPTQVEELINHAKTNKRAAFYIPTDGFDKTLISLATVCTIGKPSEQRLASLLTTSAENNETQSFSMDVRYISTVVKSNLFPIEFPQEVFQFDFDFAGERPYATLRALAQGKEIVAVPYKGSVWALGTLTDINAAFTKGRKGAISRVPISGVNLWKESALHALLVSSLTRALASRAKLETNGKDKIWLPDVSTQRRFGDTIFFTHKAVRLSFASDGPRTYLCLNPDFYITAERDDAEITKNIRQEIGRTYFESIRNRQYSDYINEWRERLFDVSEKKFGIEYPLGTGTGFQFSIQRNPAFGKIMSAGSKYGNSLDASFPTALLSFSGVQYPEPGLVFSPRHQGMATAPRDFHPMRGISSNRPFDHAQVGTLHEQTIRLGVVCPRKESPQFSSFLNRIQTQVSSKGINRAYLIDYPGFFQAYGVSIDVPQEGMDYWAYCDELNTDNKTLREVALNLRDKIVRQIEILVSDGVRKVVVICIPSRWAHYTGYDEDNESYDLHDYIKAYCAQKGIATQFVQEDTLHDNLHCQINWWLSLSYFVKSQRTPWALDTLDKDTAFAGIGYSVTKRTDSTDIVLGCSHIYNAQGQGLKYRLAKIEEQLVWDRMDRPHMSYKDAFRFGLSIVELFHTTMDTLPKRVVIHKRNHFTADEIKGLKDSLINAKIQSIDLIEINFEDDIRFLAGTLKNGKPEIHGYPVRRGTCILLNPREAILWTHGVVPSVENPNFSYYLGGRYIPAPIRIIKHYGKANIGEIANEILGLTKVNWNSFDLYNTLPATVSSSNEIARIGRLLSKREGGNYDYRFFI